MRMTPKRKVILHKCSWRLLKSCKTSTQQIKILNRPEFDPYDWQWLYVIGYGGRTLEHMGSLWVLRLLPTPIKILLPTYIHLNILMHRKKELLTLISFIHGIYSTFLEGSWKIEERHLIVFSTFTKILIIHGMYCRFLILHKYLILRFKRFTLNCKICKIANAKL